MKTRTKILLLAGLAVLSIIFTPVFAVAGDAHAAIALPPAPCASQ